MSDISSKEKNNDNRISVEVNATLFDKILEFISGISSEERIKQKRLKEIGKELNQGKYKFYNYKKDTVLPAFALYFYDIYRMCQNLVKFFDVKNHSNTIKLLLFDSILTEKQKELKSKLDKEHIEDLIRTEKDPQKAIEKIKSLLNEFVKSFDAEIVKKINTTYNQIVDLSNLINYDWYYLLHKFDAGISESNFNYKPSPETLDGKYVLDDIIAINDYITTLNFNTDWKYIFDYLSLVSEDKGLIDILKKIMNMFKNLKKEDVLTKMSQCISKDPYFKPKDFSSNLKIVQDYITAFQTEVQSIVQLAIKNINKEKINKVLMDIFKTSVIIRLKNYNQKLNDFLKNKGVNNLLKYVDPLNYLKAFLLDIGKGEIKPRIDTLIIKGTWVTNMLSAEYSQILENFTKLSDKIMDFDNKCADDDVYGKELRRLALAIKHDSKAKMLIMKIIDKIDDNALSLMNECLEIFTQAALKIKALIEDYDSKNPKLIINIKNIKWDYSNDIKTDFSEIYKKITNIIALARSYIKTGDTGKQESQDADKINN